MAGYVSDVINLHLTFHGRVEWYHGSALPPEHAMFSNLLIRPEIRYDYADRAVFDSGDRGQLTFSVDVIFSF